MYNLGEFLQCAMTNFTIVIIDHGVRRITTINKMDKEYENRTFACWDMHCGRLTFYLDD